MSRMIYPVTIAIVVGSIAAGTIRANVRSFLAQFLPPIPGPCLSIPVYYDPDDDRLTFRKPESGPYTRPMVMLDVPGDAHVDAERDVLAIRPHAWTATQCLILALAHHGEAAGIRLARPEGQPTMPPPAFPDGPPCPRRGTDRPDAGKCPGPGKSRDAQAAARAAPGPRTGKPSSRPAASRPGPPGPAPDRAAQERAQREDGSVPTTSAEMIDPSDLTITPRPVASLDGMS